ncbi:PAS domain-containing sensor histidine kinase [Agaribacterium sp. ZY112]|uniref:sensor histidine kinase n=1 Tax=Agaribacterium sp. ZY112 TaxID=3233574 RepID=UPI0035249014
MDFRIRFKLLFLLQLLIIVALVLLDVKLIYEGQYPLASTLVGLLAVAAVFYLIHYAERSFRIADQFFSAALSGDFTQQLGGNSFSHSLQHSFNELSKKFKDERLKHEAENSFLRALVRQAPVAILSFDELGRFSLYNLAAAKLFGLASPNNVSELDVNYPGLSEKLVQLNAGSRTVLKVHKEGVEQSLMMSATYALLDNKQQCLVTIENIGRELMDAEYIAWRNLISVLTHEVMNSVTPIVSLATTCRDILLQDDLLQLPSDELKSELDDATKAMKTIAGRSQGIMSFVQGYRKLSLIPKPELKPIELYLLFDEQARLHKSVCEQHAIALSWNCTPSSLTVHADKQQLEQVLLNLLKNAVEALEGCVDKQLDLIAEQRVGAVVISVQDNGNGITDEVLEQIFVPFFTTKRQGSGIGMALTRQIMHAHGGQVSVQSKEKKGTKVELIF